jgi:hypothetical protein
MLKMISPRYFWKICLALFQVLVVCSAMAQTPGYQKITWDDLLNEEWYQQMKKDMASYGRMAFLKDGSEEAEKMMASMRKKLDEAPISNKYINQKLALALRTLYVWSRSRHFAIGEHCLNPNL